MDESPPDRSPAHPALAGLSRTGGQPPSGAGAGMTIAAVMIVGAPRERFLAACLESIRDAIDLLVVNDNSGEPRSANLETIERSGLAAAGRIHVIRSGFRGFGSCRELCLDYLREHAPPGTWVLFVDCDEVHGPAIVPLVRRLLPALPGPVGVVDGYFYQFFQSPRYYLSVDRRHNLLFRFSRDVHWVGDVHEKLVGLRGTRVVVPYRYFHYGYLTPPDEVGRKWALYGSLGDHASGSEAGDLPASLRRNAGDVRQFKDEHPDAASGALADVSRENRESIEAFERLVRRARASRMPRAGGHARTAVRFWGLRAAWRVGAALRPEMMRALDEMWTADGAGAAVGLAFRPAGCGKAEALPHPESEARRPTARMRIALVHERSSDTGGAGKHVRLVGDLLRANGHEVAAIYPGDHETPAGGIHHLIRAVRAELDAFRPDVIHVHGLDHWLLPVLEVLDGAGVPVVQTLHDHRIVCLNGSLCARGARCEMCRGGRFYMAALRGCVSAPLALSTWLDRSVRKRDPYRGVCLFLVPSLSLGRTLGGWGVTGRIEHVDNPLGADDFAGRPADDGRTVVFAGRLLPEKGIATLLEAVGTLPVRLIVLGEGAMRSEIERWVGGGELHDVILRGHLSGSAYRDALRQASVVVVPSLGAEVSPTVVAEAFAAGIPVVASAVGGIPELVTGDRGVLVEPGDVAGLRSAVADLLDSPERRRRMGEAARIFALDRFSPARYYDRLTTLYSSVLGEMGSKGFSACRDISMRRKALPTLLAL